MNPRNRDRPRRARSVDVRPGRESLRTDDGDKPWFSFEFLIDRFHLDRCDRDRKASFAESIVRRSSVSWRQARASGRHSLGTETIPVAQTGLAGHMPGKFEDDSKLLIMRYHGKLPMAGIRRGRVFFVLAIERDFGDLYDHGG